MNLKIQCPKCTKRFTVHEDLTGKTVECGACDHRFPVKAESIIVERSKIYPGEQRKDDFLNRLGRDAKQRGEQGTRPMPAPSQAPLVDAIMPASAGQKMAAGLGFGLISLFLLIFFLGSGKNGMFRDVTIEQRALLGGFVSILGTLLLVFGAKNWRFKAILLAIVLVASLGALIFMLPVHATPISDDDAGRVNITKSQDRQVTLDEAGIKTRVGYLGMQRKIDEMVDKHGDQGRDFVTGIFIENIKARQFHEVEKFLLKSLSIPATEGIGRYPRNNDKDSLLVISGLPLDFDTVVRRCTSHLGEVATYPEYRLIDLTLSPNLFSEPSGDLLKKLTDTEHPGFFSSNLSELKALDPMRVKVAVSRLANVRPGIQLKHQDEIVPEFMRILASEDDPSLLSDLGKALRIYASGRLASVDSAAKNVKKWIENDIVVPKSFVNYLTDNDAKDAPLIVDQLWAQAPETWVQQYKSLGSSVENRLLFHLEESPLNLKKSALLILEKSGTSKSLPALAKLKSSGDAELKILAQDTIDSIKAR